MAEPVIKDLQLLQRRKHIIGSIILSICFVIVSITTFYGVRIFFPIVGSYGKGALNTLPCSFTYLLPLFIFYMALLYVYAKENKSRLRVLYILGYVLIAFSIFNIVLMSIVYFVLLDGNIFFQTMTPMYPLDVFIINSVYFLVGIACLIYYFLDKKYQLTASIRPRPFSKKDFVLAGFLLPFATYFFGEFFFMFIYFQEGYIDPNWPFMIPVYLSFLLLASLCICYYIYPYVKDNKKDLYQMIVLIVEYAVTITLGVWILCGVIINPYLVSQSLQWEFEIGLATKIPFGLFVNFLFAIPILIVSSIKFFKKTIKKKNEQE